MPTLYMRPTCHYCQKVFVVGNELGIIFDMKNIANPGNAAELLARGGKQQVPYLVDPERKIEMYESDDIIAYLREHYSKIHAH